MPLGSFPGVTYDELELPLQPNDVFVFCTDGIFEALNEDGVEFGAARVCEVVRRHRHLTARGIVDADLPGASPISAAASTQDDDMTAVAVKITA